MFDWTKVSDDPNHPTSRAAMRMLLPRLRQIHPDVDLTGYVERIVEGKRLLDIGVVSHSIRYFDDPGWRHGRLARAAVYCLGVDILAEPLRELARRGYHVRCVDATSDLDLGERFDFVFLGDVIEHVDNPVALLRFAARHLHSKGRVLAATPNPFSRKFVRQFRRQGVIVVNLDHLAWITPTMAYEIARRAGLEMTAYHLVKPFRRPKLALYQLIWRFRLAPVEYSFPDYLYEFAPLP
ncbi:MAG: class I SAM-dependent methyltransferase [Rhodocyclaceae bacterium]|nr:class I SAM-dependent methyltransferase [Rhodocyclaceae bacterium]